jgi:hypothetical protein
VPGGGEFGSADLANKDSSARTKPSSDSASSLISTARRGDDGDGVVQREATTDGILGVRAEGVKVEDAADSERMDDAVLKAAARGWGRQDRRGSGGGCVGF